jgi:hypothetical protein
LSGERAYRGAVRGFSLVFIALGLAVLVRTITLGGGLIGFLIGLAFVGIGVGRLWVSAKMHG